MNPELDPEYILCVRRYRGDNCIVKHCISVNGVTPKVKFYQFPVGKTQQTQRVDWLNAVKLGNVSMLKPDRFVICSLHFKNGHPSFDSMDPDYVPNQYTEAADPRPKEDFVKLPKREPSVRGQHICMAYGCEANRGMIIVDI
jgi:hypothetical protein